VPGVAFRVDAPRADIDAAVAMLSEHDWFASLPAAPGRLGTLDGGPAEGAGLTVAVPLPAPGADWLDGYAAALDALAAAVPLTDAPRDPAVVAVVGLLMDRLEADRRADLAELRRMIEGAGLRVAAIWPGDGGPSALAEAARAGTVVSLPYGRAAARTLAARTGASVLETALPVGFAGSVAWLRAVADATGTRAVADAFIDRNLDRLIPRFEWALPHGLLHKRLAFVGDPFLAAAFHGFATELGCDVAALLPTASAPLPGDLPGPEALLDGSELDLVVAPTPGTEASLACDLPFLELGFPCTGAHALYPLPNLGLEGVPRLAESVMNRIALWEVFRSIRRGRERGHPDGGTSPVPSH
jgi:nitrogenase molybdenum-iron protein alpha/beta subunit